jgi:hypothetical protein
MREKHSYPGYLDLKTKEQADAQNYVMIVLICAFRRCWYSKGNTAKEMCGARGTQGKWGNLTAKRPRRKWKSRCESSVRPVMNLLELCRLGSCCGILWTRERTFGIHKWEWDCQIRKNHFASLPDASWWEGLITARFGPPNWATCQEATAWLQFFEILFYCKVQPFELDCRVVCDYSIVGVQLLRVCVLFCCMLW